MARIFIDGGAGTTGLRIRERLSARGDLDVVTLPEELRKDISARRDALNSCDVAFLCLPDAAAVEAVSLVENPNVTVIDTSTAHRVADGWEYGFPELSGRRERIRNSRRIANPGCHATGFIALVEPLRHFEVLNPNVRLTAFSLTGYSGGGKKMIAEYEGESRPALYEAPRQYGLGQTHKHLPEMKAVCGLESAPIFCPIVASYYSGMEVTVPLFAGQLNCSVHDLPGLYQEYYQDGLVHLSVEDTEGGFLSGSGLSGRDDLEIRVQGNDERILLISRFDNLGKGASGAAMQNMNLVLSLPEDCGLVTEG